MTLESSVGSVFFSLVVGAGVGISVFSSLFQSFPVFSSLLQTFFRFPLEHGFSLFQSSSVFLSLLFVSIPVFFSLFQYFSVFSSDSGVKSLVSS